MNEGLGWGFFAAAVLVIGYLLFFYKPKDNDGTTTIISGLDNDKDDEVKCELRDAYGRTITITGHANDPQFQQMCQYRSTQPFYVYGYPYTFFRFRGRHGGGHGGGNGSNGGDGNGGGGNGGGGNGGGMEA